MIDSGEQIHIAPYPPSWPTKKAGENGSYDLTHAITLRSAAHSFEGKLTTIAVSGLVGQAELTAIASLDPSASKDVEAAPPPVSAIIGPDGQPIGDPLVGVDGVVLRTVDLADSIPLKQIHDVSGGYQRFDVFQYSVNRERRDIGMT
jgi:hypothetical protein